MRYDLVVIAAVALAVTACGSSSPSSAPSSSSSSPSASSSASASKSAAASASASASAPATAGSSPGDTPVPAPGTGAPPVLSPPTGTAAAPQRPDDKGAAYLDALTSAGVPKSASGATEIQIAQGVCTQLAQGKSRQKLVEDIAAIGGLMTDDQAAALVAAAEQHYC